MMQSRHNRDKLNNPDKRISVSRFDTKSTENLKRLYGAVTSRIGRMAGITRHENIRRVRQLLYDPVYKQTVYINCVGFGYIIRECKCNEAIGESCYRVRRLI